MVRPGKLLRWLSEAEKQAGKEMNSWSRRRRALAFAARAWACCASLVMLLAAVPPARAQTVVVPPAAAWLMHEPVSLMEWLLMHADDGLKRAVDSLNDTEIRMLAYNAAHKNANQPDWMRPGRPISLYELKRYGYHYEFSWAEWNGQALKIELGMQVSPTQGTVVNGEAKDYLSADACADLIMGMRSVLLIREGILNPQGKTVDYSPLAVRLIFAWFPYVGAPKSAPPNFFEETARMTELVIRLMKTPDMGSQLAVECRQPIDGGPVSFQSPP